VTNDTIDDLTQSLVRNEFHCNLSHIVSTLAAGAFSVASGVDLYGLCEQAAELAAPIDDYEEAAFQEGWLPPGAPNGAPTQWSQRNADGFWRYDSAEELCAAEEIEPYQRDVFEHWSVSQFMGDDLAAIGEKVDFDFAGHIVWARTTTGQAIHMDSALQKVAANLRARNAPSTESVAGGEARSTEAPLGRGRGDGGMSGV
jgi:hypothetical protein